MCRAPQLGARMRVRVSRPWPLTSTCLARAQGGYPTRFAMRALTVVLSALASDSNRFHVSTGRRTLRTAVGLLGGRPRRISLPTLHEGISHKDQSAMPSAGS